MLWLALLLAGGLPSAAFAQGDGGGDYARVAAPDVARASDFLTGVMGCDPLDVSTRRALLECGRGAIVEVVHGAASSPRAPALRLRVENVDAALDWLQHRHVPVIGDHAADTVGADGLVRIDVQTPWGQTLELVGHGPAPSATTQARLATE
ncbi:VOC family protein [Dyella sp. KRB-257]|uniref:VOC family protein n=1 Tax=Dyella sp. KRB-257 TaxID=3400915 RepID=UPI003C0E1968